MVYNAMKLFMEINPQLFDDCSHEYNEHQNNADKREAARKEKWDKLQSQADKMKSNHAASGASDTTHESQQRLDALKIHDENQIAQTAVSAKVLLQSARLTY